jgi:DNA polymerase
MPPRTRHPGARQFLPPGASLAGLATAVQDCRGCNLHERATQAVFGNGPQQAPLMLIGEQPGDAEDRKGAPFVGPAGRILDQALTSAGLARDQVYVTNAVKHFRWQADPRGGKRRIHERPDAGQVRACRPWLEAELAAVAPRLVVTLGATAGQALFGSAFKVTEVRGTAVSWQAPASGGGSRAVTVIPTIHPSAVLRAPDPDQALAGLTRDLKTAAAQLAS